MASPRLYARSCRHLGGDGSDLYRGRCLAVSGSPLKHLTALGGSLADYMAQIVRFETFVTEDLAFPFAVWPSPANVEPATASPPPQPQEKRAEADQPDEAKSQTGPGNEVQPKKKPHTRRTRKTETP